MVQRSKILGAAAAVSVVFFWSGWIVVSRLGVVRSLTVYDIAGLRYGVATILILPWVIRNRTWQGLTPFRCLILSLTSGVPYALLSYIGLSYAPAAHGGVFMNGCLPIFTAVTGWFWVRSRNSHSQKIGLVVILIGVVLVGYEGFISPGGDKIWLGDLLLTVAIAAFSVFMVATKVWEISPGQIIFSATITGAVVYVPVWLVGLESNLAEAPLNEILLQGIYQGLVPSILGISFLSVAIRHLGANVTSVFMSVVPAVAALVAIPVLGEIPGLPAWIGMITVTGGILLALGIFHPKTPVPAAS